MGHNLKVRVFWTLAVLLLLAGPVVGVAVKKYVAANERARAQLLFKDRLTKQVFLLEKQIDAFMEVLTGLRAFFESSDFVTREEFASFTQSSLARYPIIQALEWLPLVTADVREAHEARAAATGIEHYCISALSNDGQLTAAPPRTVHFPVYYKEPLDGNAAALGYDLSSEATRRRAIQASLARTEAVISDPVNLVQGPGENRGLLIFLKVKQPEAMSETQGKGACQGVVLLVLNLDDLVAATLLADEYLTPSSYAFELVDPDVDGESAILHSHPGQAAESETVHWTTRHVIETGGQVWHLNARPRDPFLAGQAGLNPVLVGAGSTAIWELVIIAVVALSYWSRSSVISRQKRILDSVLLSMAEGVVVADNDGRVILTNHAAVLLLGISEDTHTNGLETLSHLCKLPDRTTPFPREGFPLAKAIRGHQVRDAVFWAPPPNPSARGAWLSANAAPLLGPDGTQHGGVLVLRDITARKQSLEFSERMNNAVEQTADAVLITDRAGVIQYVNAAFEKSTGYSRQEVLGQTPRLLKSGQNPPEHYEELWTTILNGDVFRRMIINRKKSGEVYYADQTITPMRDLAGKITHFVAVVKDMTEYRQLRRQEIEMDLAAQVQQRLFPDGPPPLEKLDLAGKVFSADATCGDYFDFIPMDGDKVCLTVGDVSGHGISSALVMAETRAYVRSLPPDRHSPGDIMTRVNRNLIQDLSGHQFVTLVLAYLDADARRLVYASSGHDTCFVIGPDGRVKHELLSLGLPLGMFEMGDYPTSEPIPFEAGDILFLLTDGLVDCQAHRDRFLDIETCLDLVHQHRGEPAQVIIEKIHAEVQRFLAGDPQNDDITLVICKAQP